MKKTILLLSLGLTTILSANAFDRKNMEVQHPQIKKHVQKNMDQKHLKAVQKRHMKKMEKKLAHKKAMKRSFRTHKEFKRMKKHHTKRVHHRPYKKRIKHLHEDRHNRNVNLLKRSSRYNRYHNDYKRDDCREYDRYQNHRARGYRHTRNSWYLAYKYEKASFYDRHGYYYGYFNRRGYIFEGDFYRYDRYYTYRDRLRGKGLFEHKFYRPITDNYYASNDTYGNIGGFEFFFRR